MLGGYRKGDWVVGMGILIGMRALATMGRGQWMLPRNQCLLTSSSQPRVSSTDIATPAAGPSSAIFGVRDRSRSEE